MTEYEPHSEVFETTSLGTFRWRCSCGHSSHNHATYQDAEGFRISHMIRVHGHSYTRVAREEPGTHSNAISGGDTGNSSSKRIPIVQGSPDASRESSQLRFMDELFEVMLDHRWELFTLGQLQLIEDALFAKMNQFDPDDPWHEMLHEVAAAADRRDITRDPR